MVIRRLWAHPSAGDAGGAAVKRGIYRLAGHTVEIRSLYGNVHAMCLDYAVLAAPELVVETTSGDIERERGSVDELFSDG